MATSLSQLYLTSGDVTRQALEAIVVEHITLDNIVEATEDLSRPVSTPVQTALDAKLTKGTVDMGELPAV